MKRMRATSRAGPEGCLMGWKTSHSGNIIGDTQGTIGGKSKTGGFLTASGGSG